MVDDPPDNAVALQLPELLDQHLLRDRGLSPAQDRKSEAGFRRRDGKELPASSGHREP